VLLQCVAVCCCNVLQCVVAMCCSVLLQFVALCCCNVLQCVVAICCSVLLQSSLFWRMFHISLLPMNETCHTYERDMSHIWMRHVTHMNMSTLFWHVFCHMLWMLQCDTYEYVNSRELSFDMCSAMCYECSAICYESKESSHIHMCDMSQKRVHIFICMNVAVWHIWICELYMCSAICYECVNSLLHVLWTHVFDICYECVNSLLHVLWTHVFDICYECVNSLLTCDLPCVMNVSTFFEKCYEHMSLPCVMNVPTLFWQVFDLWTLASHEWDISQVLYVSFITSVICLIRRVLSHMYVVNKWDI